MAGGLGYGTVKQRLYECLLDYFSDARQRYQSLLAQPKTLSAICVQGNAKARILAQKKLADMKTVLGILA